MYQRLLLLFLIWIPASQAEDNFDPNLDHLYKGLQYWLEVSDLSQILIYKSRMFEHYQNLGYVASARLFKENPKWKLSTRAAYGSNDRRVAIATRYIQVDHFGARELLMSGQGYYFASKKTTDGESKKIVLAIRPNDMTVYAQIDEIKLVEELLKDLSAYVTSKNIYKDSVIEFLNNQIVFMGNVNSFEQSWESLILDPKIKQQLYFNTRDFLKQLPRFNQFGLNPKKGILLYGPPGTGKSYFGQILISNIIHGDLKGRSSFIYLSARHLTGGKKISLLFDVAKQLSPTTLFIEDIDLLGAKSRDTTQPADKQIILNEFLNGLDGLDESQGILSLATTNQVKVLDPALLRSGRLGTHLLFPLPKFSERAKFFKIFGKRRGVLWDKELKLDWLASETEGYSGADIIESIDMAKQLAYSDGSISADADQSLILKRKHFEESFRSVYTQERVRSRKLSDLMMEEKRSRGLPLRK